MIDNETEREMIIDKVTDKYSEYLKKYPDIKYNIPCVINLTITEATTSCDKKWIAMLKKGGIMELIRLNANSECNCYSCRKRKISCNAILATETEDKHDVQ